MLLALSTCHYRDALREANVAIRNQNRALEQQNREAATTLAQLTAQRDARQAVLGRQAAEQEKKDETAKREIARLAAELERRPVRVRIQPGTCGPGGSGAGSDATAAAHPGATDPGPPTGLLPESNSRRLAAVIQEIETMSAAYAACRGQIVTLSGGAGDG
ncbi:MAG: hypothetical protein REI09_11225 [Candidatus Dactylopiibacterium sp.]|nr:hypothetical protein [Candidatus Dactylopiibacterium sp.]